MGAPVLLGVRHHSPACARLVAHTVESLRPAYVLVEGPVEMNDRLPELLLGHELPVAVFSHYRDTERTATSWTPLCDYSPEWVALTAGHRSGAQVRFIDLPAWHPAFADRAGGAANRYADAEARYAEATERLCAHYAVDSVDALWDRLFEVGAAGTAPERLAERLDAYFALVRGEAAADAGDRAREEYMASWVRAALARAGERPVLVVTGGFHQPALRRLVEGDPGRADWPEVPAPPADALGGSFLVPYSFRQLDAFAGYQSGMPSPGYYQQVWEHGPAAAGRELLRTVTARLRGRGLPVSTADLIAARSLSQGLAALRGHPYESRVDLLDGLAGALISDDLEQPLPWTGRGPIGPGTHPVVVEMVAACTGERSGRLHPDTPLPPLVHDVEEQLARWGLADDQRHLLDLATPDGLIRSQLLHRLRVLDVPGFVRSSGPEHGADPVVIERWEPGRAGGRGAALIEAGAYGARLDEAATTLLAQRARTAADAGALAGLLFDAVLIGAETLSAELLSTLAARVGGLGELGPLAEVLVTALGLWRHDAVYGVARSPGLGAVVAGAVDRVLWLVEGVHGGTGVDRARLRALAAVRDALLHAEGLLATDRATVAGIARRIAADPRSPADLRGAAFGLGWSLGAAADPAAAAQALTGTGVVVLGDWLAGLFSLARDEVGRDQPAPDRPETLVDVLDGIVTALGEEEFLIGLPALRQAFAFFPPRERERIAARLLDRRGRRGSARSLLRTTADPLLLARAAALEENVTRMLDRHGLRAVR